MSGLRRLLPAVLALSLLAACGGEPEPPPPPVAAPPPVEGPVQLFLSHPVLGTDGGLLAVTVVNRSEQPQTFGLGGQVEHWDGDGWQPFGAFAGALVFYGGPGQFVGPDEELAVPDIGLVAPPGAAGPPEFVMVPALEAGWYRLSRDGATIAGILQIDDAPGDRGPELVGPGNVVLEVPAALLPPEQPRQVRPVVTRGSPDQAPMDGTFPAEIRLEGWNTSQWRLLAELPVDFEPPPPHANVREVAVDLPPLPSGAYRLVWVSSQIGEVPGHFWVTELLGAGA